MRVETMPKRKGRQKKRPLFSEEKIGKGANEEAKLLTESWQGF